MKLLIISESAGFPWGMAGSTRVRNIAKALIHQGADVQYIGLRGAAKASNIKRSTGGHAYGIKFSYPGLFKIRPGTWFFRRLDDISGKWFSLIKIKRLRKTGKLDSVIIYSRNRNVVTYWTKTLKKTGISIILELCEWPLANSYEDKKFRENAERFCYDAIIAVDAILPISHYIEDKVREVMDQCEMNIPMFRIPILTDFFLKSENKEAREIKDGYVLYSGSADYKSIALFVIDVICALKSKGYDLRLKFTGAVRTELRQELDLYIKDKDVVSMVEFTGYLEEDQLLSTMVNAVCLLAPLPVTEQSQARFPTKIGYYMSSGRPVVTNAVGSIKEYLTDGQNAYVAERFNSDDIASKISGIVDDPVKATQIGQTARHFAFDKFYYKNACPGLSEFLERISRVIN